MLYYVYIIQSQKDSSYYIGSTQDLDERIQRHNQGRSKYTKAKRPWTLLYSEAYPDRSSAIKRENQIKRRKDKKFIESLVRTSHGTQHEDRFRDSLTIVHPEIKSFWMEL